MRFKKDGEGVSVAGVRPEIIIVMIVAERIWDKLGQELVITSVVDGKHSERSSHYSGMAVDLRTRYFTDAEKTKAASELADSLTDDYQVIREDTHIHVQFKPRKVVN